MVDEPLAPVQSGLDADLWFTVCEAVRAYCGWHIAPSVTETVTVDGSGMHIVFLPTLHLTGITSITNDSQAFDLTDADSWDWTTYGAVRLIEQVFTWRMSGVTVEFTHGFEHCPYELTAVIAQTTQRAAQVPVSGGGRYMAGPYSIDYPDFSQNGPIGFSASQIQILDRYRLPPRP